MKKTSTRKRGKAIINKHEKQYVQFSNYRKNHQFYYSHISHFFVITIITVFHDLHIIIPNASVIYT